uniref:Zgc:100829 n=1 Tax=Astyanax mexicanus TaxID=7994 RepID=A0A3B1JSR0_ASTMX
MLQQILKDMYIDPDVLDALNEEQKKTLFLKMRQEQVRRWKEHEEKLEREESHKPKPKTAHSKSVNWLLGRDGDVQVIVIGEMDEFKASKILYSGFGERKAASLFKNSCNQVSSLKSNLVNRASTEPVRSGRENLPPKTLSVVQLNLKESSEEVRTLPPPQVSACEQKPASPVENVRKAEEDAEVDAAASLSSICYRPHMRAIPKAAGILHSLGPQDVQEKSNPLSIASRLHPHEPPEPQVNRGKDFRVMAASKRALSIESDSVGGDSCLGRGRVAELMKAFSVNSSHSSPSETPLRANKPPIPNKPTHLRPRPSPSLR